MKIVILYLVATFHIWMLYLTPTCNKEEQMFQRHHLTKKYNSSNLPQNSYITCCTSTNKGVYIFVGLYALTLSSELHYHYQLLRREPRGWMWGEATSETRHMRSVKVRHSLTKPLKVVHNKTTKVFQSFSTQIIFRNVRSFYF